MPSRNNVFMPFPRSFHKDSVIISSAQNPPLLVDHIKQKLQVEDKELTECNKQYDRFLASRNATVNQHLDGTASTLTSVSISSISAKNVF